MKFEDRYHNYYIHLLKNTDEDVIYNFFIFNDDKNKMKQLLKVFNTLNMDKK